MTRFCYVYSEQELTPRAADTISTIKKENGWDDVTFLPADGMVYGKVLVFGSRAPEGVWDGVEFIHTYSVAQIMSKANAITVLDAALKMYFNGKHEPTINANLNWLCAIDVPPVSYSFQYDQPVAIDIETDGNLGKTHTPDEVNIISIAMYDGGQIPIVWVNPAEDGTCLPLSAEQIAMFREELPKYTKLIFQNGKFDLRVMERVLGVKLCNWFDTMLAHHVLNMAAGEHGLKILAQRYLGAEDWETGIKQYTKGGGHYERIPYTILAKYNGWDVYWTYRLWELFAPQIEADENNQMAFMLEMQAADMLLNVERNGIPFSIKAATELAAEQEAIMEDRRAQLRDLTMRPEFNPNSPQQVKAALKEWGIDVASTAVEVIEELTDSTGSVFVKSFCEFLLEYRKASKIKGTYAEGWMKSARIDGNAQFRVHPTFLVHGTSTGRLSSTSPNAQNMPRNKEVRKIVALSSGGS
jgi:DNA polymerase I-like protein with 3'-5' exonuclease and polymerase domains